MTSSTLLSLLVLAVAAAASPFSLIAFSLVLATDRGPRNGVAFIAGWMTTVMLIGVVMSLVGVNVEVESSNTRANGSWRSSSRWAWCWWSHGRRDVVSDPENKRWSSTRPSSPNRHGNGTSARWAIPVRSSLEARCRRGR